MPAARPTALTAATCALIAATLAGCGGSSSGGGSSALSRADLDTQANAICAAEVKAGDAVASPDDISDAKQAAAYFDAIDPIITSTTAKLKALTPDSDAAADWNSFISAREAFSTSMHSIREKADAADPSGLTDLQNISTDDLAAAAEKVGATTCDESDS